MISILDLNLGNTKSLSNCLCYMGIKNKLIDKPEFINTSNLLIIPGVGSFDYAMYLLRKKKLIDSILNYILIKKKPIVGICIGMQILFSSSEEGNEKGLALFPHKLKKLKKDIGNKVPNVGFKKIYNYKKIGIFEDVGDNLSLYFTNSYAVKFEKKNEFNNSSMTKHKFDYLAAFQKDNVIGLQFHPELSHVAGMIVLKNIFSKIF